MPIKVKNTVQCLQFSLFGFTKFEITFPKLKFSLINEFSSSKKPRDYSFGGEDGIENSNYKYDKSKWNNYFKILWLTKISVFSLIQITPLITFS